RHSSSTNRAAANDRAGSSLQTANDANRPDTAKSHAGEVPSPDRLSRQMRRAGYRANNTEQVATVWLLSVIANGVISVAKQPAVSTNSRPQSVVPKRSTSRASSTRYSTNGRRFTSSRIARTTSNGLSLSVQPVSRWSSQYSPATSVESRGGL